MKGQTLFLLFGAVALALIAGTAFVGHRTQAELSPDLGRKLFDQLDQNTLQKLHLEREGQSVDLVRSGSGHWEVTQMGGFPASDLLAAVLEMIAGLRVDDCLADDGRAAVSDETLALYKLTAKAGLRITLTGTNNTTVADVWVGCPGPGQRGGFFRRADQNEVLLCFESRLPGLPVNPQAWVRTEMGLIDPANLTIELQKMGQPKITLINHHNQWTLQDIKRGARNEPLESTDQTALQAIIRQASTLAFDGLFPEDTRAETLGFADDCPTLICRHPDNALEANVQFATPRKLPNLRLANGTVLEEPVVPMRIRIFMRDAGQLPEYVAYFNRKATTRLFWMRQSNFDQLFLPRDKLVLPLTGAPPADFTVPPPPGPQNPPPPQP